MFMGESGSLGGTPCGPWGDPIYHNPNVGEDASCVLAAFPLDAHTHVTPLPPPTGNPHPLVWEGGGGGAPPPPLWSW